MTMCVSGRPSTFVSSTMGGMTKTEEISYDKGYCVGEDIVK